MNKKQSICSHGNTRVVVYLPSLSVFFAGAAAGRRRGPAPAMTTPSPRRQGNSTAATSGRSSAAARHVCSSWGSGVKGQRSGVRSVCVCLCVFLLTSPALQGQTSTVCRAPGSRQSILALGPVGHMSQHLILIGRPCFTCQ